MKVYPIRAEIDHFQDAYNCFDEVVNYLKQPERDDETHGNIEHYINQQGNELNRRLLQAFLCQRSSKEVKLEVLTGKDGIDRRYSRPRERTLATLFGNVFVPRLGYSDNQHGSLFPLDAGLNLPTMRYSHGLQAQVGRAVARMSYNEALNDLNEYTAGHVPKRQAEEIAIGLSEDFDAYYKQLKTPLTSADNILVMTTDGKGVFVRHEDLREATRKAAEKAAENNKTGVVEDKKAHRKRMATVASIYDVAPHVHTPESIMGDSTVETPKPRPQNKRVWASLVDSPEEVIDQMFAEAQRRDPKHQRKWVVLVDGQPYQLQLVYATMKRYRSDVTVIQDFIHVLEYVWKAAHCLFDRGSWVAENWVHNQALNILHGRARTVAAAMRRTATKRKMDKDERKDVDVCANYLSKNWEHFGYALALGCGWPIATGVIEGACRYLVKDRMELTGARWSLVGAEAILKLRALYTNGHYKDYLDFYFAQEKERNYANL